MSWSEWLTSEWALRLLWGAIPPILLGLIKLVFASRQKQISLASKHTTMTFIDNVAAVPRLDVKYDGVAVDNLKLTTSLIWNSGREPVKRENVAEQAPIAIKLPAETKIWDSRILYETRPSNGAQIAIEADRVGLEFDYLNPSDALLLQTLHTGPLMEPELEGDLVGESTDVSSIWEHQLGIHGPIATGTHQIVNLKLVNTVGSVLNIIFVSALVLGFVFTSWWPILVVAAILFFVSVATLWPSNDVPRIVRKRLQDHFAGDSGSEQNAS